MANSSEGRIVFLDYMRVFAFVSVLIGHKFFKYLTDLSGDVNQHETLRAVADMLIPLCQGGAAGVVVFFLTSGYIITHALQNETAPDFLIKRIFRIYPLYITAIVMEAVFGNYFSSVPWPDLSVFVQRILLIGDFYNTPHALNDVEWTLRIEIVFYLYMFLVKLIGAFNFQRWIPAIHMAAAYGIYKMAPFPGPGIWSEGYFNAYVPFLLAGSLLYLAQKQLASRWLCVGSIVALLILSMHVIATVQPNWKPSHYAAFATMIFLAGLLFRSRLKDSAELRLFSNLTYSVYLFHNWIWDYMAVPVKLLGLDGIWEKLAITIVLLAFCYLMHRTVETYGIRLGRPVIAAYRNIVAHATSLRGKVAETK